MSTIPSLTWSPTATLILVTLPAAELGTSTEALSDSNNIILSSFAITSPTSTIISLTSALSTPKSGALMSIRNSPCIMIALSFGYSLTSSSLSKAASAGSSARPSLLTSSSSSSTNSGTGLGLTLSGAGASGK